jgi:hypothetical protein
MLTEGKHPPAKPLRAPWLNRGQRGASRGDRSLRLKMMGYGSIDATIRHFEPQ